MRFNTMFDVAFEVQHDCENTDDIPIQAIIDALEARLFTLCAHRDEVREACGVLDTFEDQPQPKDQP